MAEPIETIALELRIGDYRLRVDHGGGIAEAPTGADPLRTEEVQSGPLRGLEYYAKGYLVLHGSCVLFGQHAICIVGRSGSGKSTLAAALCSRGARLVADGMTPVHPDTLLVLPGRALAKLNALSIALLGEDASGFPLVHTDSKKHYYPLPGIANPWAEHAPGASPAVPWELPSHVRARLGLILVPEDDDQTEIVPIVGVRKLMEIIKNAYLVEYLPPEHSSILMRRATSVIERGVQVKSLRRNKVPDQLLQTADVIEREMASMDV